MLVKPKLTIDKNTENVKLSAKLLNNVSKFLIDKYKLTFFNGDMWASRSDIYDVADIMYLNSWINKDFPLLTPKQINIVVSNCQNWLDYDNQYNLKGFQSKVYFTNGIYDLETLKFTEMSLDEMGFCPNIIPYEFKTFSDTYLQKSKFKNLKKLIDIYGQFDKELTSYFLEIIGSSMVMRTPFAKFFVWYGDGNNGKSTLLQLLNGVVGSKNSSRFSLQSLTDRHKYQQEMMSFYGKTCVFDPDSSDLTIRDMSLIKQLTGGDKVSGRHLYNTAKVFENVSTILIMTNKIPRITESNKAIDRRLGLFPLNKDIDFIPEDKKVPIKELNSLLEDIEVYQCFAQLALIAFAKAIKRGHMTNPVTLEDAYTNFKADNNDIYRWLMEEGFLNKIRTSGNYYPKELFDEFVSWNIKEKIETKWTRKGFTQALNSTLKNDFKLEIEVIQKREAGKVLRKYNIIKDDTSKSKLS